MGGVSCRACREAIDQEIEIIAERVVPPQSPDEWASGTIVPDRPEVRSPSSDSKKDMSPAVREALDALNEELKGWQSAL